MLEVISLLSFSWDCRVGRDPSLDVVFVASFAKRFAPATVEVDRGEDGRREEEGGIEEDGLEEDVEEG